MEPIPFQMNPLETNMKLLYLREVKEENLAMTTSHKDDSSPQVKDVIKKNCLLATITIGVLNNWSFGHLIGNTLKNHI